MRRDEEAMRRYEEAMRRYEEAMRRDEEAMRRYEEAMRRLGEACSQIAALLFKMMSAALYGLNEKSRTSVSCVWNQFYRKRNAVRVLSTSVENDDGFDAAEALRSLKRICPSACILTKDDSDTDTASDDEDLPPVLSRFHEVEHESLCPTDLEDKCQRFVRDFQVLPQQVMNLEAMTKGQQDSVLWQRQRRGRITATAAHDVLTLKQATTKSNELKRIMKYNVCDLSRLDDIKFGRQHEETASHEHFNVSDCGLFVDSTFPLFAATPDVLRECSCHGKGRLKIKCSYKHRDSKIEDIKDQSFYLNSDNKMKTNHRYYSQIQFQMYVCGKTYCDFVVFTYKGIKLKQRRFLPKDHITVDVSGILSSTDPDFLSDVDSTEVFQVMAVKSVYCYQCCDRPACINEKIADGKCPSCNKMPDTEQHYGSAMVILKKKKRFSQVRFFVDNLKKLFEKTTKTSKQPEHELRKIANV
ncbi:AN-like protein [Mya arenaria]|uniref:AN-like protein n=1 Tax=Mya arenaria TaxID=6604 RepID=A0ABY7DDS5_MYAAR|nr:AN-like protein [Mya arenaria]